jgi:8-oxo-dGTP pyrophosphatase MutT (NUDIX family)
MLVKNIQDTLEKYQTKFPDDLLAQEFFKFLENPQNYESGCVDRKNMNGHFTVSGMVLKGNKILLLWHKSLQRVQQPGGHIDPPDKDLVSAVVREVLEETGLVVESDRSVADGLFSDTPILLAINNIPERKERQEGAHKHFDFWFLLKLKDENQKIKNEDDGTEAARWVSIDEVSESLNPVSYQAIQKYKLFSHK